MRGGKPRALSSMGKPSNPSPQRLTGGEPCALIPTTSKQNLLGEIGGECKNPAMSYRIPNLRLKKQGEAQTLKLQPLVAMMSY